MKKSLCLLSILVLCLPFYSIDFGGSISTTGYVENAIEQLEIEEYSQASFWLLTPIGSNFSFATEANYSFDYNYYDQNFDTAAVQKADLSLFKFTGNFNIGKNDALGFALGRFSKSDLSGVTFSQQIDGLEVNYRFGQTANLSIYSGYTGLLNAHITTMDSNTFVSDDVLIYTFACPYLISGIKADFPVLFAAQNLSCEFYSSIDLAQNAYTKLYGALRFDGPIYKSLYYVLSSTFDFNVIDTTATEFTWGNLSRAELSYYTGYKSLIVNLNASYASSNFKPITVLDSTVDGQKYNSLMKVGALGTIKIINPLLLSVSCDALFNIGLADTENGYSGIQYKAFIYYQMFDDLLTSLSVSQMFYADTDKVPYLEVKVNIKLAL